MTRNTFGGIRKLSGYSTKALLAWGPITLAVLIFCGFAAHAQPATVDTTWELGNVYDDRDLAAAGYYEQAALASSQLDAALGGITPNSPGHQPGGPLYLLIGPTNGNQVWINLTNTHYGVFYQLESVHGLANPGPNSWTFGPILQDTNGTNEISYGNFQADRYLQT